METTFNDIIAKLNTWLLETLGEWTLDYYGIWLVALALVTLILLIVIICAAASGASKNKKIKTLKSQVQNGGGKSEDQIREEVRAEFAGGETGGNSELTAEQLDELETLRERCNNLSFAVDDLNHKVIEKQNTIDELSAQLEQANEVGSYAAPEAGAGSDVDAAAFGELKDANDELENENASLRDENMDLQSRLAELQSAYDAQSGELESLRNDNAELKKRADNAEREAAARPAVTRPVVTTRETARETTEAPAQKREAVRTAPVRQKPEPEPVDEDAAEDEVYDDYGDDNSPVKVTLKYDNKKNNWIILRSDTDRTYRRLATKAEAVMIAKDLARRLHAQLVVHKKDGKFQKV